MNIRYTSHTESLLTTKALVLLGAITWFCLFRMAAFPLTSATESCWRMWRVTVISSSPVCRASALPIELLNLTYG